VAALLLAWLMGAQAARGQDRPLGPGGVLPPARQPHRVAVIRRPGCAVYEKVLEEFRGRVPAVVRVVSVEPRQKLDVVPWLRRLKPHLVFAIGQTAYNRIRAVDFSPVIHALVYHQVQPAHVAVVEPMPPENRLQVFRVARPSIRRVAVLHGPASAHVVDHAEEVAAAFGLTLHPLPAASPSEAISLLRRMSRRVEGIWLVPDLDILTPQVVQYALGIQFRRHVLLMGATCRHVEQGALFAMDCETHDVGRRAAQLANRMLAGGTPDESAGSCRPRLCVNRSTATYLRIPLSELRELGAELFE